MIDRRFFLVPWVGCLLLLAGCEQKPPAPEPATKAFHSGVLAPVPAPDSVSGRVLTGRAYQPAAMVFLDRNGNRLYDNGEPLSITEDDGRYRLLMNPGEAARHALVAMLPTATAGTAGQVMLETPQEHGKLLSPLTTLVKLELEKNPTLAMAEAQWRVKDRLGIADEVSLFADYLEKQHGQGREAVEYGRTARVADVIGWLLEQAGAQLADAVGDDRPEDYERLAAFLITDQLDQYAELIRSGLDRERNFAEPFRVEQLRAAIEAKWSAQLLTRRSLDAYARRIQQKPQFWDASPPRVLDQVPVPGGVTTIDTVISLRFDKPLDRDSLPGSIVVTGEAGRVSGAIHYSAEQRLLRFIPDELLAPESRYQVHVGEQIADTVGNLLMHAITWDFSTTFARKPPPLPGVAASVQE